MGLSFCSREPLGIKQMNPHSDTQLSAIPWTERQDCSAFQQPWGEVNKAFAIRILE